MGTDYGTALEVEGRDLVLLAQAGGLEPVEHREREIAALLDAIDRGQSVLLTGPAGIGKSAVLRGAAQAMAKRGRGRIVELSTVTIFTGTRYLGEWQSKLSAITKAAMDTSAALAISDVVNLASAGRTAQNDHSVLDALRPLIESRSLVVVGEVTPETLRQLERTPRFADLFYKLPVEPLVPGLVDAVIETAARRAGLAMDAEGRHTLVQLTTRFLPTRPQPGPALALLEQVRHYQREKENIGEAAPITRAFIERVFSIYSGLPPFIVSREATMPIAELRAWFRERLIGQEEAIDAVVEAIALFKAGLHDPARPLGTFLFVGPTGVGKTELARAIATFLFGSPMRMLRFDLSEFKDYHSFQLLVGDPKEPDQPAALVDPVRAQPFQVVLFDELEKAHANVWDLLLPVLDEGRLTPPSGQPVDFRSTLVICTSNVGAQESQQRPLGFGEEPKDGAARIREALETHFRPEFLNRFQHVVVFHPLTREQVRQVARKELARILQREGIVSRNLVVDVEEDALDLAIERGFDARYGARALKREIQSQLALPVAMALMEKPIEAGQIVKVVAQQGRIQVQLLETPDSRQNRREKEPVRTGGRKWTREDLVHSFKELYTRIEEVARRIDEGALRAEQERLVALRADPAFWRAGDETTRNLRELDYATATLDRLAQLRADAEALLKDTTRTNVRSLLSPLVQDMMRLESAVALAELELVQLGREDRWDALVEIKPLGVGGKLARDTLVQVYGDWARDRKFTVELLREPFEAEEQALLGITGSYAFGLLRNESGLHRIALPKSNSVARVRVAAWTDRKAPVGFLEQHALKRVGAYGGKVRSRLECGGGLVLQNSRTLAENREVAITLAGSWREMPPPSDDIVRRYEPETPLVRDVLTDTTSGHPEALKPERFHELLCERVRIAWQLREEPPPAA